MSVIFNQFSCTFSGVTLDNRSCRKTQPEDRIKLPTNPNKMSLDFGLLSYFYDVYIVDIILDVITT
jgi:hypothetical protein